MPVSFYSPIDPRRISERMVGAEPDGLRLESSGAQWHHDPYINSASPTAPVECRWTQADEDQFVRAYTLEVSCLIDSYMLNEMELRNSDDVKHYVTEQLASNLAYQLKEMLEVEYTSDPSGTCTIARTRVVLMTPPTLRDAMRDLKRACVEKLTEMFKIHPRKGG